MAILRPILQERAEALLDKRQISASILDKDLEHLIQDLHLHQLELEIQNEDLMSTQSHLEAAFNKYATLYELAPISYFTLDESGMILDVNQAGLNLLNVRKHFLVKHAFSRYLSAVSQSVFHHCRLTALQEETLQKCEIEITRRNGGLLYAQLNCKTIRDITDNKTILLVFLVDITERKKADFLSKELNYVDKVQSVNTLASVLAHELNGPLSVIENYLHGCIRRIESNNFTPEELLSAIKNAVKQTRRSAEILLRMRNFSSHCALKKEVVSIHEMIKEWLILLDYEKNELDIRVLYKENKNLPLLYIDKIHIIQVMLNLGRNALEAMRDANIKSPLLKIEINYFTKDMLEINIIDNGPGVAEELVDKIFLSNFTTKPYGIGLGLVISRTIIETHGGKIEYTPYPTGGSCFTLTVPTIATMER